MLLKTNYPYVRMIVFANIDKIVIPLLDFVLLWLLLSNATEKQQTKSITN